MDSEREERLLTMLPQIRDPVVLEEFAGLLNLAVRRDVRGNWKNLYKNDQYASNFPRIRGS